MIKYIESRILRYFAIRKLNKFLKKHKVYDEYYECYDNRDPNPRNSPLNGFRHDLFIKSAFVWTISPSKHKRWENLNDIWLKLLTK